MTAVEILLPASARTATLEALLDRLASASLRMPFAAAAMAFVGDVSRAVLADRAFRAFPELVAMAHWFRPVTLRELAARVAAETSASGQCLVPRGVVFHLAPANVDSVFIYSWLLALLCGNASIVRISRRRTPQMEAFVATAAAVLASDEHAALAAGNLVVSYEHDAAVTEALSKRCHLRVVWGGDDTIRRIRAVPLPPLAAEVAFANRFSLAVMRAEAVAALDESALRALVHGFFNDGFWFNQQACSSPRAVVWIGSRSVVEGARAAFWPALAARIARGGAENQPAQVMDRTTMLFRLAREHPGSHADAPVGELPSRLWIDELTEGDRACHDGNGLFLELARASLDEAAELLAARDQTIAQFGFARNEWLALLGRLPPHAADRIVPVGQALAFGTTWDGVNLIRAFTRELVIA